MSALDWFILVAFISYTVWDGIRRTKGQTTIDGFFLSNRSMPWWAMGISVMATQASAITFIGTTGQAYVEDIRFVQVYLGMPFAMIILSLTLVPFYYKARAFSAYEVLEKHFGLSTRLVTSFLFLVSRGLALGTVIAAPAYVLSLLLDLPLSSTILAIGLIATGYTMLGGITGVIMTDVKQMAIMVFGIVFSFGWISYRLHDTVSLSDTLYLAGSLGKLHALDLSFDPSEKYNIWSGVLAGLFLMLSYFGSDQTQVQRYLTAKSLADARKSLMLSAFAKVPMQFIILLLGVFLYVFYIFHPAPTTFRAMKPMVESVQEEKVALKLHQEYEQAHEVRKEQALVAVLARDEQERAKFVETDLRYNQIRDKELERQQRIEQTELNDTNYIFPWFILHEMPIGIIGLIVAAIFAAALSSIDSALNALSTCTIVDWYQRLRGNAKDEHHYLIASKASTVLWGIIATLSALALGETASIIELVNQIGSFFYGSILGIFLLLLLKIKMKGSLAVLSLFIGMFSVYLFDGLYHHPDTFEWTIVLSGIESVDGLKNEGFSKSLEYLWLNPIGTGAVVLSGWIFSFIGKNQDSNTA